MESDFAARLERLESLDAIRQLGYRYALAVDSRDLDALVECFVPDVEVGRDRQGRAALKEFYDAILRQFRGSSHFVGNHLIDFEAPDRARGVVYCRVEHDWSGHLAVCFLQYMDEYERVSGEWLFRRRRPLNWYATDQPWPTATGTPSISYPPPLPGEPKGWGGGTRPSEIPGWWPTWHKFWGDDEAKTPPASAPWHGFLSRVAARGKR